ncbi:MAG TPA: salicylate hydroxylase [Gammaproteobacteria bacterium]|nr:salicylate hydroxylase [Gammaproteobacteria bacterium]|tara:strand:- start:205 stop:1443 length:1239 start_codon:yes stop_codon:yes gene_type:complete
MKKRATSVPRTWPDPGSTRIPYWIYTDQDIFDLEMERIFCGSSWAYVGLSAELLEPGSFITTNIGDRPVIICRNGDGELRGFVNRCAHRGIKFCRHRSGQTKRFTCPYHQWTYDLNGDLKGVPFMRGVNGQGGMPEDFDLGANGLQQLKVIAHNGVLFASFDLNMTEFTTYLGESNRYYFERVCDGRELRLLGHSRQLIRGNWKLMFENIKDPYHASLLHVFLVTFGLFRADQQSQVKMDRTGGHGLLISRKGEQKATDATQDIENLREDFKLKDPRLLDPVKEFKDSATVVMQTLWPNLIVQQQSNTIAMRQVQPRDPSSFILAWTFFGYADDDEAMTIRRLRQANLMSASGLVSCDDSEVIKLAQDGINSDIDGYALFEMGGRDTEDTEHMVTETAIRAFYKHYRAVMDL